MSVRLTPRCLEVIAGVTDGLTNDEIAKRMGIGTRTVKQYLQKIYTILGVSDGSHFSKVRLAVWWNCELFQEGLLYLGLLPPSSSV